MTKLMSKVFFGAIALSVSLICLSGFVRAGELADNEDGYRSSLRQGSSGRKRNRGLKDRLRKLSIFDMVTDAVDNLMGTVNMADHHNDEDYDDPFDTLYDINDPTPGIFMDDFQPEGHGRKLISGFSCYVKMRWTSRSRWQEETKEFKWCMAKSETKLKIRYCPDEKGKVKFRSDGTFRMANNSKWCLTNVGGVYRDKKQWSHMKKLRFKRCNGSSKQKFRFVGRKSKFMIIQNGRGVGPQHHPRLDEIMGMVPISYMKRDRTRYWKCTS